MSETSSLKRLKLSYRYDLLPNEIVSKILWHLLDDVKSLKNFFITCRRFNQAKIDPKIWKERRPINFNLDLDLDCYKNRPCSDHGSCIEHHEKNLVDCEIIPVPGFKDLEFMYSGSCFHHRLYCLMQAKHRVFSGIKFSDEFGPKILRRRCCIDTFRQCPRIDRDLHRLHVNNLIQLEFYGCFITDVWLVTMLNQLDKIANLTLCAVEFKQELPFGLTMEKKPRKLDQFRFTGKWKIEEFTFAFFVRNIIAAEFDITGTTPQPGGPYLERFLNVHAECFSKQYEDFHMFMRGSRSILKKFIADDTYMDTGGLYGILEDDDLSHVKISVKNCPFVDKSQLELIIDEDNLSRVTF